MTRSDWPTSLVHAAASVGTSKNTVGASGSRISANACEGLFVDLVEDREEQVLLAVEVLVDRAAGEAGGLRDLVERRAVEAAAHEHLGRGVDERGAGELASPFGRQLLDGHGAHCR